MPTKTINLKQIKDFNIKPEPLGWLEASHASPATPSYEGRSIAIKASCDALLHMGTGELWLGEESGTTTTLSKKLRNLVEEEAERL